MIGTLVNAGAIFLCGAIALATTRQPSTRLQTAIKGLLGVATVYVGLRLTVTSMGGGWPHIAKQFLIVVLSLILGRLLGQVLHLQKLSNRLGQYASHQMQETGSVKERTFTDGFMTASLLFCLAPLAFLGAIQDGLSGKWQVLAIKAVMDGMTMLAFVSIFGWSVIAAAVPVLAFQGTISLVAKYVASQWLTPGLIDSINATGGLLVFSVALVILEIKKLPLTDYLPSLLLAPVIAWLWPPW